MVKESYCTIDTISLWSVAFVCHLFHWISLSLELPQNILLYIRILTDFNHFAKIRLLTELSSLNSAVGTARSKAKQSSESIVRENMQPSLWARDWASWISLLSLFLYYLLSFSELHGETTASNQFIQWTIRSSTVLFCTDKWISDKFLKNSKPDAKYQCVSKNQGHLFTFCKMAKFLQSRENFERLCVNSKLNKSEKFLDQWIEWVKIYNASILQDDPC